MRVEGLVLRAESELCHGTSLCPILPLGHRPLRCPRPRVPASRSPAPTPIATSPGTRMPGSGPVADAALATGAGAVRAAVDRFGAALHTMPQDPHAAVGAAGGHGVDGALETVEGARLLAASDSHRLVVVIATGIAGGHDVLNSAGPGGPGIYAPSPAEDRSARSAAAPRPRQSGTR